MTPTPPEIHPDGRYNATQACRALGVCRNTLRKYVIDGRIRQRLSRRSTRPYYLGRDLMRLWMA